MHTPFTAICFACGDPVGDDDGVLHVDVDEATSVANALEMARGLGRIDPFTLIELAHWRVHHNACRTEGAGIAYVIDVDYIRTFPQLAHWTAHLMTTQPWLAATDWPALLERLADTGTLGAAVVEEAGRA